MSQMSGAVCFVRNFGFDWYINKSIYHFVLHSHRPLDLDNIYNQDQVKLLMKEGEHLTIPDFDDIYADSEVTFFFLKFQDQNLVLKLEKRIRLSPVF